MKNKLPIIFSAVVLATATMLGGAIYSATAESTPLIYNALPSSSYHCASVHFGMNDLDLTGTATLTGGTIAVGSHNTSLGTTSGVTMTSYTVSTQAIYMVENCGLKMSSSSKNSTVEFNFEETILGCDIYAIGWKGDASYLTINNDASTKVKITNDSNITGTGTTTTTYVKYHFDFDDTKSLVITATKRVVLGDIALRIKN